MKILRPIGVLALQIFLRYLGAFLAFGLIYVSIIRDIDPRYWVFVGYPLVFLAMWVVVYSGVKDGVKKISSNEASIWKIGFIAATISVFLWLLVRFPGVTLLSQITDWIVPVDLSGFNFLIPSSVVQLSLLTAHINLLWLFPLQFVGAILFLAALIVKMLSEKTALGKVSRRTAIAFLATGSIIMAGVQAVYIYYYFTVVPNFYASPISQSQNDIGAYNEKTYWITYRNDKYGLSIQYPPLMTIIEGVEYPDGLHNGFRVVDSKMNGIFTVEYYTSLDKINMGAPLPRESLKESLEYDYSEVKEISIDNIVGYKAVFYNPNISYAEDQVWVRNGSDTYIFSYNHTNGDKPELNIDSEIIMNSVRWLR